MVATTARRSKEGTLLTQILEEAYRRRTWNGTNLLGVLADITPAEAAWVPPAAKHPVAGVVLHCAYWKHVVRGRLLGERRRDFPIAGKDWFDTPPTLTAADWQGYLDILADEHAKLLDAVRQLDRAGRLAAMAPTSPARPVYGIAMHDVYHTGQIALLRAQQRRATARGERPMKTALTHELRHGLLDRRRRLTATIGQVGEAGDLVRLLAEIDAALDRAEVTPGRCEVCGDRVDDDLLALRPAMTYCLCALSPQQLEALGRDLEAAWRIQAALLPPQDETIAGWDVHYRYRPAGAVSGDYCDVQRDPDDHEAVHLFVGDVTGKGIAAALVMAQLASMLRNEIRRGAALDDLLRAANGHLGRSVAPARFATLLAVRAQSCGAIEIANAGHCPPMIVGPGGMRRLSVPGFPLGVVGAAEYGTQHTRLHPGESLVLYSDGLCDAMNPMKVRYGVEALERALLEHRALPPTRLAQACLDDIAAFQNGAADVDDVTLMIARFADGDGR